MKAIPIEEFCYNEKQWLFKIDGEWIEGYFEPHTFSIGTAFGLIKFDNVTHFAKLPKEQ